MSRRTGGPLLAQLVSQKTLLVFSSGNSLYLSTYRDGFYQKGSKRGTLIMFSLQHFPYFCPISNISVFWFLTETLNYLGAEKSVCMHQASLGCRVAQPIDPPKSCLRCCSQRPCQKQGFPANGLPKTEERRWSSSPSPSVKPSWPRMH